MGFAGVEEAAGGGAFVSGAADAAAIVLGFGFAECETVGEGDETRVAGYAADAGFAFEVGGGKAVRNGGVKGFANDAAYELGTLGCALYGAAGDGAAVEVARKKGERVFTLDVALGVAVGELDVVAVADKESGLVAAFDIAVYGNVFDHAVAGFAEEALGGLVFGADVEIAYSEVLAVEGAAEGGAFSSYGRKALSVAPIYGIRQVDVGGEAEEQIFGNIGMLAHPGKVASGGDLVGVVCRAKAGRHFRSDGEEDFHLSVAGYGERVAFNGSAVDRKGVDSVAGIGFGDDG